MKKIPMILAGGLLLMTQVAGFANDSLWLPSIFSENMVLQRELPVPIWGRPKPGMPVAVTLYDGGKNLAGGETVADADTGRWRVDLPTLPTGGRYTLLIEARGDALQQRGAAGHPLPVSAPGTPSAAGQEIGIERTPR